MITSPTRPIAWLSEATAEEIDRARAALDRRSQVEDARWEKQKEKLETALRRARD
jgi:colicin import membrane protein